MPERNDYPRGVPCWVDTLQPDPQAAVRFYGELMSWTFEGPGTMPGNPPGEYDIPRFRQAILADPQGAVFTVSQPKREGQRGSFIPPARSTSRRSRCQRLASSSASG
jgi:predicted enzyme related to lactoylglutathione lyase